MIFSVVIPLFNKRKYIKSTIDSVLAQTFTDFEIIIIDDGSTDGSVEIAEELLKDTSNSRVILQNNSGVSQARNKGISNSRGDWVAFLDADDYWHPTYLATLFNLISEFVDVEMVATNLRAIPDSENWSPFPWASFAAFDTREVIKDLPRRWFAGHPFITSSVAVRTALLQSMQPCFPPGESNGEDIDLWFRLYEVTSVARTSSPLVTYPESPVGGLSSKISNFNEPPYVQRMLSRSQSRTLSKDKRAGLRYFVAQQRISLSRRHLANGQRLIAIKLLGQACAVILSKRWLATLIMTIAFPSNVVKRWNEWRYFRKAVRG